MSTGKEAAGKLFSVKQITRSLHKIKRATHKSAQQPLAYFLGDCTCKHSLPHTNVNLLLHTPPVTEHFKMWKASSTTVLVFRNTYGMPIKVHKIPKDVIWSLTIGSHSLR